MSAACVAMLANPPSESPELETEAMIRISVSVFLHARDRLNAVFLMDSFSALSHLQAAQKFGSRWGLSIVSRTNIRYGERSERVVYSESYPWNV